MSMRYTCQGVMSIFLRFVDIFLECVDNLLDEKIVRSIDPKRNKTLKPAFEDDQDEIGSGKVYSERL